jgi:hypothetical protein
MGISGPYHRLPAERQNWDSLTMLLLSIAADSFEAGRASERGDIELAMECNRRAMVKVDMVRGITETRAMLS